MDSGLVCLAIVARFHGRVANPDQLSHALALSASADKEALLRAARRLELKAKLGTLDLRRAAKGSVPLPCIVELQSGAFAVLARVEGDKALLHDPAEGRPSAIPLDDLASRMTGTALYLTSRATLAAGLARFDFTWFIPAIVKYRRLIGEALVASLFLQIFALVTPLFFQVVVDKVLVHKGQVFPP